MSEQHIPVFCATDENYAPFASITMMSVLMHTDSFIDFYIMDGGIKEETKKLIDEDLKAYSNKTLHYIDMTKYNLKQFPNIAHFSVNAFARYFIPDIAPDLNKIVYLDVDIIVKGDIAELYNQDMEGYALVALPETTFLQQTIIEIKKIYPSYQGSAYFNSGVLLLDVQKLIQMNFTQNAIELTVNLYHKLIYADQDVWNIIFENNYKHLNNRFNLTAHLTNRIKKAGIDTTDPVIIHYTYLKPWKEHCPFEEDFNQMMDKSVFKKRIIEKWRAQEVKEYYLFGKYPLFTRVIPKSEF